MSLLNLSLIILFALSFFNGIFLVLKKSYSSYKNGFLGVTIMIYSLFFASYVWWYQEQFILQAPFLMRTVNPLMFLAFPFFYFFVRNTIRGEDGLTKRDWVHFIPALIHFLELIPFYALPIDEKYNLAVRVVDDPRKLDELAQGLIPGAWVDVCRMVLQLGYYLFSIQLLFRNEVKQIWGRETRKVQNWLLVSVVLIGMLLFSHMFHYTKDRLSVAEVPIHPLIEGLSYLLVIVPIVLLNVYLQINQNLIYGYTLNKIITGSSIPANSPAELKVHENTISRHSISANIDLEAVKTNLASLMKEDKIYLNPDLVLADIADKLKLPDRVVSQVIKLAFGVGVKEYINQYRIQDAMTLMQQGFLEEKSIEGLCRTVGFNSRVTFFLAFKKSTGLSPTDYMRQS
jgi:AraC-like DNA-binding protein